MRGLLYSETRSAIAAASRPQPAGGTYGRGLPSPNPYGTRRRLGLHIGRRRDVRRISEAGSRGRAEKGWADRVCSGVVIGNYSGPNGERGENETPSSENDARAGDEFKTRTGQDTLRPQPDEPRPKLTGNAQM